MVAGFLNEGQVKGTCPAGTRNGEGEIREGA